MNTTEYDQIWESLHDEDFRKQFIDEHINVGIAFQIRALRNRQDLTQSNLAKRLGGKNKQPLISSWEDPNYGQYSLGTLKDLAKAFDVGLLVRFVPFSKMVDWTVDLTSDLIAPAGFKEEERPRIFFKQINEILSAADNIQKKNDFPEQLSSAPSQPYEYVLRKEGQAGVTA